MHRNCHLGFLQISTPNVHKHNIWNYKSHPSNNTWPIVETCTKHCSTICATYGNYKSHPSNNAWPIVETCTKHCSTICVHNTEPKKKTPETIFMKLLLLNLQKLSPKSFKILSWSLLGGSWSPLGDSWAPLGRHWGPSCNKTWAKPVLGASTWEPKSTIFFF